MIRSAPARSASRTDAEMCEMAARIDGASFTGSFVTLRLGLTETADQVVGRAVMTEPCSFALQFEDDALGQSLAEFDAH